MGPKRNPEQQQTFDLAGGNLVPVQPVGLPQVAIQQPGVGPAADPAALDAVEKMAFNIDEPQANPALGQGWLMDATWPNTGPGSPDNYAGFVKAFEDMAKTGKGGKLLLTPNSIYNFTTEDILYMRGLQDVVIDGQGSTLVFSRQKTYTPFIQVDGALRLKFQNLNIDWNWNTTRPANLVRVVAATPSSWTLEYLEVPSITPAQIVKIVDMHPVNEETLTVGQYGVREFWDLNASKLAQGPAPNQIVVTLPRVINPGPTVGQTYILRSFTYEAHGMVLYNAKHITFENCTWFSTLGMGVVLQDNCEYFYFNKFKITVPGGTAAAAKRILSVAADGIHTNKALGHLKLEGCEFAYQGDDALNVHDPVTFGVKILGPNQIQALKSQQWKIDYKPGDVLDLRLPTFAPAGWSGQVVSAQHDGNETWTINVNPPLPALPAGTDQSKMILFNNRWNVGDVIVRNSLFHSNRARGLLLECNNVLVENNTFRRIQLAAIRMEADVGEWNEGIGTKNIVIKNNVFDTCDVQNWGHGVIWTGAGAPAKESTTQVPLHGNIRICNNQFLNMPGNALSLRSCCNVTVSGNKIVPPAASAMQTRALGARTAAPGGIVTDPNPIGIVITP
jgi:hypothetical protein